MRRAAAWLGHPGTAFVAALALHVTLVFALRAYRHPFFTEDGAIAGALYAGQGFAIFPKAEQPFYSAAAKAAARACVLRGEPAPFSELHPTSLHAPGYPYVLYGAFQLLGRTPRAFLLIGLLQALAISSLVFPLAWLARRWFGPAAAVGAMWLIAGLPLYTYYATQYLNVALSLTLHPWLLRAWLGLRDRPGVGRAAAVGAFTGLAALCQPLVLALYGLLGAVSWVGCWRAGAARRTVLAWLAAPLAVALVLAPWTLRNYRVQGEWVPIRSGAGPFWIGNNPHATGAAVVAGGAQDLYLVFPPRCIARGTELTEMQYHRLLRQEALDYIRQDPGAFLRRTAKKILWFWTWVPREYLVNRARETTAVTFLALSRGYWVLLLALTLVARLGCGRFPGEYRLVLGIHVLVYSLVYGLIHVGQARFRGEVEYLLLPAVALGGWWLWQRLRRTTNPAGRP